MVQSLWYKVCVPRDCLRVCQRLFSNYSGIDSFVQHLFEDNFGFFFSAHVFKLKYIYIILDLIVKIAKIKNLIKH